jgi:hypothetical protein
MATWSAGCVAVRGRKLQDGKYRVDGLRLRLKGLERKSLDGLLGLLRFFSPANLFLFFLQNYFRENRKRV